MKSVATIIDQITVPYMLPTDIEMLTYWEIA